MANVSHLADHRKRRRAVAGGLAAVATAGIAAAVLAVVGVGGNTTHVSTKNPPVQHQPDAGSPVHWTTNQVELTAGNISIVANGKTFTSAGAKFDVNSDPGDPSYQTLELGWNEHGVRMLMNIYFAADAHNWWATEIRTYNGKAGDAADWIEYMGKRFTTPLGQAFDGNVDLSPTDGQAGHLSITGLHLEAFRPAPACAQQTGRFAVQSNESDIVVPTEADAGFSTYGELLDRTSCTRVKDISHIRMVWTAADPTLVHITAENCSPDVTKDEQCASDAYASFTATRSGDTTVHLAAVDTRTNKVVAQTDVPVKAAA